MAKTALVISMTSAMFNCSVIGNDLERWEMMKVPTTMYDNSNGMDCIVRVFILLVTPMVRKQLRY